MERLIRFLRKPRLETTDSEKASRSRFQWGWDGKVELYEPQKWTLSILGIINGLSKRYVLLITGVEEGLDGNYKFDNSKLRLTSWTKLQEEMDAPEEDAVQGSPDG